MIFLKKHNDGFKKNNLFFLANRLFFISLLYLPTKKILKNAPQSPTLDYFAKNMRLKKAYFCQIGRYCKPEIFLQFCTNRSIKALLTQSETCCTAFI